MHPYLYYIVLRFLWLYQVLFSVDGIGANVAAGVGALVTFPANFFALQEQDLVPQAWIKLSYVFGWLAIAHNVLP
jgi:hypothetical protein